MRWLQDTIADEQHPLPASLILYCSISVSVFVCQPGFQGGPLPWVDSLPGFWVYVVGDRLHCAGKLESEFAVRVSRAPFVVRITHNFKANFLGSVDVAEELVQDFAHSAGDSDIRKAGISGPFK